MPPVRAFDWIDIIGDNHLDLVVFGSQLAFEANLLKVELPSVLACNPPAKIKPSDSCAGAEASFTGAALPAKEGPSVIVSMYPGRKMFRVDKDLTITSIPFPDDGCTCIPDCSRCPPVLAIATRDLDGDRELDIIAIDAKLRMYTAFAADGFHFMMQPPIDTPAQNVTSVTLSISGAPLSP